MGTTGNLSLRRRAVIVSLSLCAVPPVVCSANAQLMQNGVAKSACISQSSQLETAREALKAADELCSSSVVIPGVELLVTMAVLYSRAGDTAKSTAVLEQALATASGAADQEQRWHDLWVTAYGQAKVGNVEAVVRTADLASSMSVEARVGILQLAADTLSVDLGRTHDALAVARLIRQESREESTRTICFIAQVMAERGDGRGALKLLEEINVDMAEANRLALRDDSGSSLSPAEGSLVYEAVWKAGSFLSISECLARAGQFAEATKLVEGIGFGSFPDRALRRITHIAADKGLVEVARRTASQVQGDVQKGLALGDVAVAQAAQGQFDDSLRTVAAIARTEDKGEAMTRIAVMMARRGDDAGAAKVLATTQEMRVDPLARQLAEVQIVEALASRNELARAEEAAKAILDPSAQAQAMAAIGKAYSTQRDVVNSRRCCEIACESACRIEDPYTAAKVLREVAASSAETGDVPGSAHALEEAGRVARTIPIGGGTDVIALEEVAVAQAKSGDKVASRTTFQLAIDAAQVYPDEEYVAALRFRVMAAQAASGDPQTALATAEKVPPGIIKCGSLLGIASGLLPGRDDNARPFNPSGLKTDPPPEKGPPFRTED